LSIEKKIRPAPGNENSSHEAYSEVSQTHKVFCWRSRCKPPSSKQDEWGCHRPTYARVWMDHSLAFPKDSSNCLTRKEFPTKSKMPIAPELVSPGDLECFPQAHLPRKVAPLGEWRSSYSCLRWTAEPLSPAWPRPSRLLSGDCTAKRIHAVQIDVQAGFHITMIRCHSVFSLRCSSFPVHQVLVASERIASVRPVFFVDLLSGLAVEGEVRGLSV
jgi:hypothetical protein